VHAPPTQVRLAAHAVAFCQPPTALQVCGCEPVAHCVCPGPQTPVHEPALQVVPGPHALPLSCQLWPVASHVTGCWPLHPIAPGVQNTHAPL
jgi:hypothetical protein